MALTSECKENIRRQGGTECSDGFCERSSIVRDKHCTSSGLPRDYPYLCQEKPGVFCYCCCTCFTQNTPIEVLPGKFAMIETLEKGDQIMATGLELDWKSHAVACRSGSVDHTSIPGLFYVSYLLEDEQEPRHLLVTLDHLFLMHDAPVLKAVQYLIPGSRLMAADGKAAIVQFVTRGTHSTTIQTIEMEGEVNPKTLEGHLLNSNGVVSADYSVQVLFECNPEVNHLLARDENVPMAGTKEYLNQHQPKELLEFMDSPHAWPKGFRPDDLGSFLSIPATALRFLRDSQAIEVFQNGTFDPRSSCIGQKEVQFLFKMSAQQFPDVTCILDSHNDIPNIYAWRTDIQRFIVLTGGLVRLKGFHLEGLAMALAVMQSALNNNGCVCEWDYEATSYTLRRAWPDQLLMNIFTEGMQQITNLFALIKDNEAGQNSCLHPSLACRLESLQAGISPMALPECAGVHPAFLAVKTAYVTMDNARIYIGFNDSLDPKTAKDISRYALSPSASITEAILHKDRLSLSLVVKDLPEACPFVLSLDGIVSSHNRPLGLDQRQVIVNSHPKVEK